MWRGVGDPALTGSGPKTDPIVGIRLKTSAHRTYPLASSRAPLRNKRES